MTRTLPTAIVIACLAAVAGCADDASDDPGPSTGGQGASGGGGPATGTGAGATSGGAGGSGGDRDVTPPADFWDATGIHDLGSLSGSYSEALAIDGSGQFIVGQASVAGGPFLQYHAFLHVQGRLLDLNALIPAGTGWVLERASGLNDHGQIVGRGTLHGQPRGFLLTPS